MGYIPENIDLETGDVIRVDEYFNFLDKRPAWEAEIMPDKKVSAFRKDKITKVDGINEEADETIFATETRPERILIIGNEGLAVSYKLTLLKNGYFADVVSGVDSWHKIEKAVRQSDIVVFVTEHAKHQNYYKYKDMFGGKKTIYAANEGANRIVELLNNEILVGGMGICETSGSVDKMQIM